MKVKGVCAIITSELQITFDEDPHNGDIDIILPVGVESLEILGDKILNTDVNLMMVSGDTLIISTNSRN